MSAGWMDSAVSEVLESLNEERSRTRAGFNPDNLLSSGSRIQVGNSGHARNPESTMTAIGAGFEHIWKMLPALKDIPAEMLRSMPLSTVL
jgi:hypothetical protein